jgi:hypothetical protein
LRSDGAKPWHPMANPRPLSGEDDLASDLLIPERMSPFHKKIVEVLEGRYGVSPLFAEQFVPVFDQVAQSRPSSDDWEQLMECVAAAYRALPQVEDKSLHEAQVLVGQFVTEMKKIDESLKVVTVFLDRLRQQLGAPDAVRVLH